MKSMSSAEVRQTFLDFFEEMGHRSLASSSLVPADDPTLLFVNAGMVQFKDVFLGLDKRDYSRATTSQKCMRVSGKHNDLENVGPSPRHHTFFEMLGNFSFGDYFKHDAIKFAYKLLTEVYHLPADRLVFTVYENDDEAYNTWVDELRRRSQARCPHGPLHQLLANGRYRTLRTQRQKSTGTSFHRWERMRSSPSCKLKMIVSWRSGISSLCSSTASKPIPSTAANGMCPLPAPGVDTGMGLERIVSILQGVEANYETDLFMPIIQRTQELTGHSDAERDANIVPYRVIADHIRAAVFLISDGVYPGAKGRSRHPAHCHPARGPFRPGDRFRPTLPGASRRCCI